MKYTSDLGHCTQQTFRAFGGRQTERQDARRAMSQRKPIERLFGWSKLDRQAHQVKLRGLNRVDWFCKLSITAQNPMRIKRRIPIESQAQ